MDVSIIIPTLNEKGNIRKCISSLLSELKKTDMTYEILVIDDDSGDDTGKYTKKTFQDYPEVRTYIRRTRPGLGNSILYGVSQSRGNIIVGIDADGNHDPRVLLTLIQSLESADVVVASRFVEGGGMADPFRYAASRMFNWVLQIFYKFPIRDNTSGYYAIRRGTIDTLHPSAIYKGYGDYHLRLVYRAYQKGLRIKEVPVYYPKRIYGQSKSKFSTMISTYLLTAHEVSHASS